MSIPFNPIDRREHERFALAPGYTAISVRPRAGGQWHEGHAYDISEGGVRLDLDDRIPPGTIVEIKVDLPRSGLRGPAEDADETMIAATGTVVWCDDEDPGAVRMGVRIAAFANTADRERLLRRLSAGLFLRAA